MSPRAKLLNNKPLVDRVRDMVDGEVFDTAADAAMLHFIESLGVCQNVEQNALQNAYVLGARDFLKQLRTIVDVPKPQKPTPTNFPDNLNPRA